jgi:hypothetical protein
MMEAPMMDDAMSYTPFVYAPFIGFAGKKAMAFANGLLAASPLTKAICEKAS